MADTPSGLIGGRYRVLGNLGKGAMGLVFMAHDPVLDRKVAIKQMTAEIADNEELRQRFYVEARAAARLNHPNIITIHELQESGGEIFMIMELLEGKALSSLVEAKPVPLSLEAALDVMSQVCDGLDYAHQKAIVHRDIKPANLFLTASGTVKVLDFGIARLGTLHMTATGALVGTPDYMSPEQIRGDEIDRRTDLWAVGAVLYQLLSGAKPFEGRPLAKLLSAISQTPHMPLQQRAPAVPKSVSDLVDRLLSKPRDGRPASAGIVRDELRAILGRESSSATRAMLAQEGYEETVFMSTAGQPSAPAGLSASPAAAAPWTAEPAGIAATIEAPLPWRTAVPKAAEMRPPSGKIAATSADELAPDADRTVIAPPATAPVAPPRATLAVAAAAVPPPLPVAQAAPTSTIERPPQPPPKPPLAPPSLVASEPPKVPGVEAGTKTSSHLLVAAVVVGVLAMFALALVGGAAWWWWSARPQRTGADSLPRAVAATTTSPALPPAQPTTAQPAAPAGTTTAQPAAATATTGSVPEATAPPSGTSAVSLPPPLAVTPPAETVSETPAVQSPPLAKPPARPTTAPPAVDDAALRPPGGAPAQRPAAIPPSQPPIETGVASAGGARPGVTQDTVESLTGKQPGQAYDTNTAASIQAATTRINLVLEQYVKALVNADAEAIREYRPSLSPEENALMRARQLKVRLEDVRVEVNGTEATVRCRRKVAGTSAAGAPLQEDGVGVYRLLRKPTGWVIVDMK